MKSLILSLAALSTVFVLMEPTSGLAQDAGGSVDASFNANTSANPLVLGVVPQPDGKILLGGQFTTVNGAARNGLARVNADGTLDAGFNPAAAPATFAATLALQPDGKVLAGSGTFRVGNNNAARTGLARLNADGSLDNAFAPNINGFVYAVALGSDGKIVVGGTFSTVNGTTRKNLARLNADGTLDASFDPGVGPDDAAFSVFTVIPAPGGKFYLGGGFTSFGGTPRAHVARVNADGSLDASFDPGSGADSMVNSLAVQTDGRLLVSGDFSSFNGVARQGVVRLDANGSVDLSFNASAGSGFYNAVAVQTDGKILLGGLFNAVGGAARNGIARLNADGSADTSFDPGSGVSPAGKAVYAVSQQADGRVLIGGQFSAVNGAAHVGVARLFGGNVHPAFFNGEVPLSNGVYYLAFPANGNVFGYYTYAFFPYLYHFDLGFEYFFDANDSARGAYLYDFTSSSFFYTSPSFPFPYLYDFKLNAFLYYFPDANNPGRYTRDPRYFFNFATGQIITK